MTRDRAEWLAFAVVVLIGAGTAVLLQQTDADMFRPYFGALRPVAAVVLVLLAGALALRVLNRRDWFAVWSPEPRAYLTAAVLAAVMAVPVIVVDFAGGFPADINVGPPESLLFYPLIGLVAECVFHLVPLGVVALLRGWLTGDTGPGRTRAWAMGMAALIEPTLQVVWGSEYSPVWANSYVGVHVLVINLFGLLLFRRYGFTAMYFLRFVYYGLWHIGWGALRLALLFDT